ncbi:MAG TPA: hypothetical protein VMU08_04425 [Rhizomicrobium sp.]|nr:hypothetical protein [Rhizomicrobium sp.]
MKARLIHLLACLCLLAPGIAEARGTAACDFLSKSDVENVTGKPVISVRQQPLNICAGLCESTNGTQCQFKDRNSNSLALDLYWPPYALGDWVATYRKIDRSDRHAQTADISDLGAPALWSYRRDRAYGVLRIIDGDRVHFAIRLQGENKGDVALANARALATLVLARLRAK